MTNRFVRQSVAAFALAMTVGVGAACSSGDATGSTPDVVRPDRASVGSHTRVMADLAARTTDFAHLEHRGFSTPAGDPAGSLRRSRAPVDQAAGPCCHA
jgi:uncharacterized protein (DUF849 family)